MLSWRARKDPAAPASRNERPLYVLSQRGPLSFDVDEEGMLQASPAGGGLASAFGTIAELRPLHWIAVAVSDADRLAASQNESIRTGQTELHLVALPPAVERLHYWAFANPLLWLIQHGLSDRLVRPRSWRAIARAWSNGYEPANAAMAQRVAEVASNEEEPVILVQDYHFYLAPRMIREALPKARIAHFVHIPWPEPDAWAMLPRAIVEQILDGLLGADVLGFQTTGDVERFLATCRAYRGDRTQPSMVEGSELTREMLLTADGSKLTADRSTLVGHFPITVDAKHLKSWAEAPEAQPYHRALKAENGMQTIVRVDRLDPTKNIAAGFEAYGLMLEHRPDLRGKVRFLAHLVPSRAELAEYQIARREALAAANAVNERFGLPGWRPIQILYEENRPLASALLSHYDALLVNSLADGMHLVAKEGAVLNQHDGLLVLSRRAGAWEELGPWALGVDPTDIKGTAQALEAALTMSAADRRRMAKGLHEAVQRSSLQDWLD
ncbi:MAG TPA: trehalose-6-phosphate synthase, partial [Chloroflexota bacterium]